VTDLYADLGVARDATQEEIGRAFRRLARQHHPDAGGDPEAFKRIQAAEHVLGDPTRRTRYDATGETNAEQADPVQAAALALIEQLLGPASEILDPARGDHIGEVLHSIALQEAEQRRHRKSAEKSRAKIEALIGRIRKKAPGGEDPVRAILTGQLRRIEDALQAMDRALEVHARARQIVEGYEIDIPPPPAAATATTATVAYTTTGGPW
jgi:curved DNA-binding protein CbpA